MTPKSGWSRCERGILACFLLVIASLWIVPMGSSLWLDETVTAWVIHDGFDNTMDRGERFSGGNPSYYAIVWAFTRLFGTSEIALRLPSLFAMLGATYVLFLLGRDIRDRESGLIAGLAFACTPIISFEARNARTYAIGLFFIVCSWYFARRWVKSWKITDGLLHAFFLAAVFHIHYLLSIVALVNAFQVLVALRRQRRVPVVPLLIGFLATLMFCAPSFGLALELYGRKGTLYVVPSPSYRLLWRELFPEHFGATIFIGAFFASYLVSPRLSDKNEPLNRYEWLVLAAQWLTTPLIIFLISRYTFTKVYIPRYFIGSVAGMSLILGIGLRTIGPQHFRFVIIGFLTLISAIGLYRTDHHDNNWRNLNAAIRKELAQNPDLVILAHCGLVEAKDLTWFDDPERRAYLSAPFSYYPIGKEVIPLPYTSRPEDREYMHGLLVRLRAERKSFLIVSRRAAEVFHVFFMSGLKDDRYHFTQLEGTFGNLILFKAQALDG
jgi:mannosyltransferase